MLKRQLIKKYTYQSNCHLATYNAERTRQINGNNNFDKN